LDRFTEQGIFGLLAILLLIAAFALNIGTMIRTDDNKYAFASAAIGSGMAAVLASHCFIGELIPTSFYFYLWVAVSFAATQCVGRQSLLPTHPFRKSRGSQILLGWSLAISLALVWYAQRNWHAESMLQAGEEAANAGNMQRLLSAKREAEAAMHQVGTYHLEFARLMVTYLSRPHLSLDATSRKRLAEAGITSASWALRRTDKPMLALQDMILLADIGGDPRFEGWINDLKQMDPYWYRPHEMSAWLMFASEKVCRWFKRGNDRSWVVAFHAVNRRCVESIVVASVFRLPEIGRRIVSHFASRPQF
jgi:hypothetical protein